VTAARLAGSENECYAQEMEILGWKIRMNTEEN